MKTLVVYASHFGNTEWLARSIATKLSAFGPTEVMPVEPTNAVALEGVDVLVVASPTEVGRPLPAMRAYLKSLACETLAYLSVACFDTCVHLSWPFNGSAAKGMARQLRRKGVELLVPPETFFVQSIKGTQGAVLLAGEEERAVQWAVNLHSKYATTHPEGAVRSS